MRCFVPQHDKNRRTVIPTIGVILIFLFLIISNQRLLAQKNTKIGELKGVDFKFGFTGFDLSGNDAAKIYSDIVLPDLEKNNKQPTGFSNAQPSNYCSSFYLGLTSKNKWFPKSTILKNSENRFGVFFGNNSQSNNSSSTGAMNCDVTFKNYTEHDLIKSMVRYVGYGIRADYIVNSKPFLKDFAAYFGISAAVILHNYKAYYKGGALFAKKSSPYLYSHPIGTVDMVHTSVSFTSIDTKLLFGWKYNLSCDFNYFMEFELGGSYYNKGMFNNRKLLYTGNITVLGIRYKFINPEEKTRNKANVFW